GRSAPSQSHGHTAWRHLLRSGGCGQGYAYAATLGEGETFTTVELKINFFRPVREGKLAAEARLGKGGSTLGHVECDVKDAQGKLVARAASTCMKLVRSRP